MIDWLPGYEQVPITKGTGPGTMMDGYAWKLVLHSTESGFGSIAAVNDLFRSRANQGFLSAPHFCIDPGTRRKVQYIPISWSAVALRGGRNGYETNRGRAIQVEICGKADEAEHWSDDVLDFIASWCADVVNAGVPIDLNQVTTDDRRGTYAIENSPYRFTGEEWKKFPGLCDHANVPFNDHYDVGRLNKHRIAELAKKKLALPEEDEVTPQDIDAIAKRVVDVLASPDGAAAREAIADGVQFFLSGEAKAQGVKAAQNNRFVLDGPTISRAVWYTVSGQAKAEQQPWAQESWKTL